MQSSSELPSTLDLKVSESVLLRLRMLGYEQETPALELRDIDCPACGRSGLKAEGHLRLSSIERSSDFPRYAVWVRCTNCLKFRVTGQDFGAPKSIEARRQPRRGLGAAPRAFG